MTTVTRQQRLRTVLRHYWTQYKTLYARRRLIERPWLEDVLHWSADGELHGHLALPDAGGPASVTPDGWCPGRR